jgi:predicted nucleic-acid-binding protein
MIAIDSNVLARYVRNDDPVQSQTARRLIDETSEKSLVLVVNEVLAEVYWLLAKRQKMSREAISAVFWALLDNTHLHFTDRAALAAAIDAYALGPAGFVDYLIAATALAQGAEYTATFDKDAARHEAFRLLSSGDR